MPSKKVGEVPTDQLMSKGEAEGRSRQWLRDISGAHKTFQQRLPLIARMSRPRRGGKMKAIRSLAQKLLAPALIHSESTRQGCELHLLDVSEKGQMELTKLTVDHDGKLEFLQMNMVLSLHFVARVIQYYRVRRTNPLKSKRVREILAAFRRMDGEILNSKILVHDDEGIRAKICCKVEELDDGQWLSTATTFIIEGSLYPDHLQAAEEMRQMLRQKGSNSGEAQDDVTKDTD